MADDAELFTAITPTPMPTTKSLVPAASSPIGFPAPAVDADFSVAAGSVATATGTSTGTTSLTLASVVGKIGTNDTITGTGVPANLKIVAQVSGTPSGAGVYTTNIVSTLAGIALTFTGSKPLDPAGNTPPIVVNPATVIPGEPLIKTAASNPYALALPTFAWMPLKVGATSKFNQAQIPPFTAPATFPWNPTPPPPAPGP